MNFIEELDTCREEFEKMPGVTVIHELDGFKPLFMTSNGLDLLGLTLEELIAIKEDYQLLFFNQDFMGDYLKSLRSLIEREGIHETFSFFHQVKIEGKFRWYAASLKVFKVDHNFSPTHTITYAVPLEDFHWITKAERLLEETNFGRDKLEKFTTLSKRELQVLALAAKGNRTAEMASSLKISADTVNSHLKSIRKKLDCKSSFELTEYARAYDLL
ncbi:helix-turn-helix transcriptional regulator [Salinimicrobium sp. HB62]|uniref:helix-turn-helix transcriptional regulator n=1 Tax=Salinimicrobium sp. HB62 TaxID=3077781 RepID=UPI002D79F487|nr:helix-turn-helix transcriptional regulator [Salinimicrobium sp. HB62]